MCLCARITRIYNEGFGMTGRTSGAEPSHVVLGGAVPGNHIARGGTGVYVCVWGWMLSEGLASFEYLVNGVRGCGRRVQISAMDYSCEIDSSGRKSRERRQLFWFIVFGGKC